MAMREAIGAAKDLTHPAITQGGNLARNVQQRGCQLTLSIIFGNF